LKSTGRVQFPNKRIGEWVYFYENGGVEAYGKYDNTGMKDGRWTYSFFKKIKEYDVFWETYRNEEKGFSINVPENWSRVENYADFIVVFLDNREEEFCNNFNITCKKIIKPNNFLSLSEKIINDFLSIQNIDFKLLNVEQVFISKFNSIRFSSLVYRLCEYPIIFTQFIVPFEKELFLLSFFTGQKEQEKHQLLINEIAFSFRINFSDVVP
jgi:hypothetical protein